MIEALLPIIFLSSSISSAFCTNDKATQSTPISRALFKSALSLLVNDEIGRITPGIFTPLLFEIIPSFKTSVVKLSMFCFMICSLILPSSINISELGVNIS